MDGSQRLHDLERRLQFDPSPFVLAQLADEYRRAGRLTEAVNCCRNSLSRHPGYHSARLILARALVALARPAEAALEYEQVVAQAPDNLAAARELAEICEKQGRPADALTYYRRAFTLARNDKSIEAAIERLSSASGEAPAVTAVPPPAPPPTPVRAVRPNPRQVDFDAVLSLLGRPHQQPPPLTERLLSDPTSLIPAATGTAPASTTALAPSDDALGALERDLREHFEPAFASSPTENPAETPTPAPRAARIDGAVQNVLEAWLDAIADDRDQMRHF